MITAPREPRASLPAELRGLRRDGARLCVVERSSGRITPHDGRALGEHLLPAMCSWSTRADTAGGAGVTREHGDRVQLRPGALRGGEWDALAVETRPAAPQRRVAAGRAPGGAGRHATARGGTAQRRTAAVANDRGARRPDGDAAAPRRADPVLVRSRAGAARALPDGLRGDPGLRRDPSAGRHLTWELLGELRRCGVDVIDIVLHCGLSSFQDDAGGPDQAADRGMVRDRPGHGRAGESRGAGRRVGTSVIRTLETPPRGGRCGMTDGQTW